MGKNWKRKLQRERIIKKIQDLKTELRQTEDEESRLRIQKRLKLLEKSKLINPVVKPVEEKKVEKKLVVPSLAVEEKAPVQETEEKKVATKRKPRATKKKPTQGKTRTKRDRRGYRTSTSKAKEDE
jgi:cell envelope opacity-associated protein A